MVSLYVFCFGLFHSLWYTVHKLFAYPLSLQLSFFVKSIRRCCFACQHVSYICRTFHGTSSPHWNKLVTEILRSVWQNLAQQFGFRCMPLTNMHPQRRFPIWELTNPKGRPSSSWFVYWINPKTGKSKALMHIQNSTFSIFVACEIWILILLLFLWVLYHCTISMEVVAYYCCLDGWWHPKFNIIWKIMCSWLMNMVLNFELT